MKNVDLSHGYTIRTFGFNVPCRQFIIGAQVTRDKRMPMVDEFVLRVLKMCEKVSTKRLTSFFGFSQLEMQIVLADLQARTLIVLEDNYVALHQSANEMFRTAGEGPPHIVEVEGWVNRIWFDLISQSMIASPNFRNVKYLIELKQPLAKQNLPTDFARDAFHSNFREYLKNIRKINNPEHLSLYAITSVDAARFSHAQITGHQVLRCDPNPKIETMLHVPEVERTQRLRQLTDAMTQALSGYSEPEPSFNARTEFGRLIGSDSLVMSSATGEFIDIRKWIEVESTKASKEAHAFIGISYLEANRRAFLTMLELSPNIGKIKEEDTVEIMWFRPGGSLWGTSEDLRAFLSELRGAVRKYSYCNPNIRSTLVVPAVQREQKKRFGNIFDQGVCAPTGLVSPSIEIILIRGIGALVSVLVPLSPVAKVWIGQMTVRAEDLDRIEKRIHWKEKGQNLAKIWSRDKSVTKTPRPVA